MSDFEELLRRSLRERAGTVRTAPDERDVMRRIRRSERVRARAQTGVLVGALVVVAGSVGGVLGAVASRPAGVPLLQTSDAPASSPASPPSHSGRAAPAEHDSATHETPFSPLAGSTAPAAKAPAVHQESFADVTVDWLFTGLARPVEVVPGPGQSPTCAAAGVVSLTVDAGGPVASASGAVGLPRLQPDGLAVLSSGNFGSAGRPSGWWAVLEAGSAARDVAVQFPSGAIVRAPVGDGGLAVVAALVPAGGGPAGGFAYGSAVSEGATRAFGSLELLFGGGIAAVGEDTAGAGSQPLSACPVSGALAGGVGGAVGGAAGAVAGPPDPLAAAGDVVAAYAQAYDVDPLLGLTWNFAAVDLASPLGCAAESLTVGAGTASDGLAAPAVQVEAVAFTGPASAVVVYRRTGGNLLETGTAVLVDGIWKVGGAAYCADMQAAAPAA